MSVESSFFLSSRTMPVILTSAQLEAERLMEEEKLRLAATNSLSSSTHAPQSVEGDPTGTPGVVSGAPAGVKNSLGGLTLAFLG